MILDRQRRDPFPCPSPNYLQGIKCNERVFPLSFRSARAGNHVSRPRRFSFNALFPLFGVEGFLPRALRVLGIFFCLIDERLIRKFLEFQLLLDDM